MKNTKTIIILLLAVLVLAGCSHNTPAPKTNAPAANEAKDSGANNQAQAPEASAPTVNEAEKNGSDNQAPAENAAENNNTNSQAPETAEVAVEIKNFAFSPASLTVKAGTTVVWTNNDSAPHNVKSDVLNSPNMAKGDFFKFTFKEAGEYNYICGIHPSMKAKIIVE